MAGTLPPVIAQYTTAANQKALEMVALLCTGELQYRVSVDTFDPMRIASVADPGVTLKNMLSVKDHFISLGENVPDQIADITTLCNSEVTKLNNIIAGFTEKVQFLTEQQFNTTNSIAKLTKEFTTQVAIHTATSAINIATLSIRDLTTNCLFVISQIMAWWIPYILETMATGFAALTTPDLDPLVFGATPWDIPRGIHGIFEGMWIALLMMYQITLIMLEITYLMSRITEYIIATVIGELLLTLTFISRINSLNLQLVFNLQDLTEQILGLVATQPLPIMVVSGMVTALLELTAIQQAAKTVSIAGSIPLP